MLPLAFRRIWILSGMPLVTPLFEANVFHVSQVSAILVSFYACTWPIILEVFSPKLSLIILQHVRHKLIRSTNSQHTIHMDLYNY